MASVIASIVVGMSGGGRVRIWHIVTAIAVGLMLLVAYSRLEDEMSSLHGARRRLEQYLQMQQQRSRWPATGLARVAPPIDSDDMDYAAIAPAAQQLYDLQPIGGSIARGSPVRSFSNYAIDEDDQLVDAVVVYNRLPKTASTTLMGLAYDLCESNRYHVLHVNISRNNHIMSLGDQARFARNASSWAEIKPALYHGHFAYVDFAKFGAKTKPIYVNLLRKPLDRLVSYYYFLRYGDDYRPHVVRRKTGDKMTFDECVEKDEVDCAPENMWLQIPFFCGHSADCWVPGSAWALDTAKHNLVHNYMLVGVTEELHDFIVILEATLPRFFKGATQLYLSGKKSHLRRTATKIDPAPTTVAKIQTSAIWKMENEFYEFALEQFHFLRKRSIALSRDGVPADRGQKFTYEKIRPK